MGTIGRMQDWGELHMVQNDKYQRVHGIFKCVTVCLSLGACYFDKINPVHAFSHLAETSV